VESDFEWDRILLAVALLAAMFVLPALVIWRDQVRDRHRFGTQALSRPVRYAPDGQSYREGTAPAAAFERAASERAAHGWAVLDGAARQRAGAGASDGAADEARASPAVPGGHGR
jgi:hypothetical protein